MDSYLGIYALDTAGVVIPFTTTNGNSIVLAPAATPTYRGHSPSGPMESVYGSAARLGSGAAITGATNATPIVVTAANHGLITGDVVVVSGALGNTAANGTFTVTVADANTFSLNGSTGNGAYTGGGAFSIFGLWAVTLDVTVANGYLEGDNYTLEVTYANSGNTYKQLLRFSVG